MNVYEIVTKQIMEKLEAGVIPWQKPWIGSDTPKNLISKKGYRGINLLLLAYSGFTSPYWITFKQCGKLGGQIKKGEKGTIIVFWKIINKKDKDGEIIEDKHTSLLRYYRVWNTEQCEIDSKKVPVTEVEGAEFNPIERCEEIVSKMQLKPEIVFKENRAVYYPSKDLVNMPKPESFVTPEEYYSTLFHELAHSTGHRDRLDRKSLISYAPFGSSEYSKEELVAEITASFLCGVSNIENKTLDNSTSYIAGWLKKLKDDPKMVVLSAGQAQKASDFILNLN